LRSEKGGRERRRGWTGASGGHSPCDAHGWQFMHGRFLYAQTPDARASGWARTPLPRRRRRATGVRPGGEAPRTTRRGSPSTIAVLPASIRESLEEAGPQARGGDERERPGGRDASWEGPCASGVRERGDGRHSLRHERLEACLSVVWRGYFDRRVCREKERKTEATGSTREAHRGADTGAASMLALLRRGQQRRVKQRASEK